MYRQIYPINEQMLTSSIDLPERFDETQLPVNSARENVEHIINNNNNNSNNIDNNNIFSYTNSSRTSERIKREIKAIEDKVRSLRQVAAEKAYLSKEATNNKRNVNNATSNDYIDKEKSEIVQQVDEDALPMEIAGISLRYPHTTQLQRNKIEGSEQNVRENTNDNVKKTTRKHQLANTITRYSIDNNNSNNNNSNNVNTDNLKRKVSNNKHIVSKRANSLPARGVKRRNNINSSSNRGNVHIAFGHRVYPESETSSQRHTPFRYHRNNDDNDVYGDNRSSSNNHRLMKYIRREVYGKQLEEEQQKQENKELLNRPESVKSDRTSLEVVTAVHTPHKNEDQTTVATNNAIISPQNSETYMAKNVSNLKQYNNNTVISESRESNANDQSKKAVNEKKMYWGSSARALELREPFSEPLYRTPYTAHNNLHRSETKEEMPMERQVQVQPEMTLNKLLPTRASNTFDEHGKETQINNAALSSLQSQVQKLQDELKERDVLLRNATNALAKAQRDRCAYNKNNNNSIKKNKETNAIINDKTLERECESNSDSKKKEQDNQELEHVEMNQNNNNKNNTMQEIEDKTETNNNNNDNKIVATANINNNNKMSKINNEISSNAPIAIQPHADYERKCQFTNTNNSTAKSNVHDVNRYHNDDTLSEEMHSLSTSLSKAQHEIHFIQEKFIQSQEREAELRVQLMHREQETERLEAEIRKLLVVIDELHEQRSQQELQRIHDTIDNAPANAHQSPSLTFILKELETYKSKVNDYEGVVQDQKSTIILLEKRLTAWEEWYNTSHTTHNSVEQFHQHPERYTTNNHEEEQEYQHYNKKREKQIMLTDNVLNCNNHYCRPTQYWYETENQAYEASSSSSSSSSSFSSFIAPNTIVVNVHSDDESNDSNDIKEKNLHISNKTVLPVESSQILPLPTHHTHHSVRSLIAKEAALMQMAAAEEASVRSTLQQWQRREHKQAEKTNKDQQSECKVAENGKYVSEVTPITYIESEAELKAYNTIASN